MANPLGTDDQIVAAIRRIIRAVDLHSRRLAEEYGLTGPQLAVLREAERLGHASISSLARLVHLSQPTVTGIVNRLEKRGLLQRCRDESDRRTVNASVTPAGREMLDREPPLLQDRFSRELAKLQEWERTTTLASLQRIAAMMDADTLEASPVLVPGPMDAVSDGSHRSAPSDEPPQPSAAAGATNGHKAPKEGNF